MLYITQHMHYRQKYGKSRNTNRNTRVWSFDLLEMASQQPQKSIFNANVMDEKCNL